MKESSEEFALAFISAGSIWVECEFCQRVHFADDPSAGDFEEGELEALRASAEEKPDEFCGHDGSAYWSIWEGKALVLGCPCGADVKLEREVWDARDWITNYLVARATVEADDAAETKRRADAAAKAIREAK